jgi:thioredoxin-related protein
MSQGRASPWARASDIVFIATCVVLLTVTVLEYARRRAPLESRRPQAREDVTTGLNVPIQALGAASAARTALVVISPSCIYCQRSLPFYARLLEAAKKSRGKVRVAFASLQSPQKTAPFFKGSGLNPDMIVLPLEVPVAGTPTLLVFDRSGTVISRWIGQLSPDQETKALRLLQEQ